VDDEEHIRNVVKKILERFGYRAITAANGAEAVAIYKARQKEIAVVLTDMAMPVMDGPAAIVELKSINPEVKIIGSSGMASEGTVANAAGAGLEHFLSKPYTAEAVLQKLQELLQG
jgi:CheY-like chemotaxis protein